MAPVTVVALHPPDPTHLEDVLAEMRARHISVRVGEAWEDYSLRGGASPLILGYEQDGAWQAIVGSHRIAAAVKLGVPVTLAWVDPDAPLTLDAIEAAAGEVLSDLPLGVTPREIVAERELVGSGVRYECEVTR